MGKQFIKLPLYAVIAQVIADIILIILAVRYFVCTI